MSAVVTTTRLFEDFNEQLMLNGLRTYYYNGQKKLLLAYIDWCAEKGVDPMRLMMARHQAIKWRFRLGPKKLMQTTDAFLGRFREWGNNAEVAREDQQAMWGSAVDDTGGLHLAEVLKRTWASEPMVCEAATETHYRADSRWCGGCEAAPRCWRRDVGR